MASGTISKEIIVSTTSYTNITATTQSGGGAYYKNYTAPTISGYTLYFAEPIFWAGAAYPFTVGLDDNNVNITIMSAGSQTISSMTINLIYIKD